MKTLLSKIETILMRISIYFWGSRRIQLTQILVNFPRIVYKPVKVRFPDLIRYHTLHLCAINALENNLEGNVAELGVYQGDFAKNINAEFSNRKLYLFDTFEGFDKKHLEYERSIVSRVNDKSFPTSEKLVLDKMPYSQQCIIKKGVFPETAKNINTKFVFVSIDVDLYQPTLAGLKFFYPNLVNGGYIFIHDYNNRDWPGVKKAVNEFCKESDINFIPIPDANGTVIITK